MDGTVLQELLVPLLLCLRSTRRIDPTVSVSKMFDLSREVLFELLHELSHASAASRVRNNEQLAESGWLDIMAPDEVAVLVHGTELRNANAVCFAMVRIHHKYGDAFFVGPVDLR